MGVMHYHLKGTVSLSKRGRMTIKKKKKGKGQMAFDSKMRVLYTSRRALCAVQTTPYSKEVIASFHARSGNGEIFLTSLLVLSKGNF
jgi:hypothetical protein